MQLYNRIKDQARGEPPGTPLPELTPLKKPKSVEDLIKLCWTDFDIARNLNLKDFTVNLMTVQCDGPSFKETTNPKHGMPLGPMMTCS